MISPLERALNAVRNADSLVRGVDVTYLPHDASEAYTVRATPTAPRTEVITADGVSVDRRIDDWIIEVADLQRLPARGDYIIHEDDEYMVSHQGGGREYDYHDSYHRSLRVHTIVQPRRVDVVAGYANRDGVAYGNVDDTGYAKPYG